MSDTPNDMDNAFTNNDGFPCDCGSMVLWPDRESDVTCGTCGAVWEHDGITIGGGARIKVAGRAFPDYDDLELSRAHQLSCTRSGELSDRMASIAATWSPEYREIRREYNAEYQRGRAMHAEMIRRGLARAVSIDDQDGES